MRKNRIHQKKADATIYLIVAAAIGLILLVVVLAIFGKETGDTIDVLDKCETRGGECKNGCMDTEKKLYNADCDDTEKKDCCITLS